jgi:iduronate 2-sulfatase
VETLDIFPTLCDLAGLPIPDFVDGVSLRPLLEEPSLPGHPAFSYNARAKTIHTGTHRLILHNDGHAELYDHASAAKETKNIAATEPALVEQLSTQLKKRLNRE